MALGVAAITRSTGIGARARLFLIAVVAIASVAISHPSLGAAATYASALTEDTTLLAEGADVSSGDPATSPTEEPSSTGPVVSDDPAEAPAPGPVAEPPVADAPVAEPPVADAPVAEPPVAEPPPVALPTAEAPPLDSPTTEPPPLATPTAEPVDTGEVLPPLTDGFEDPAVGAPVALPTTPEAAVPEEPELAPVTEPGQSVVIQTSSEGESVRPITGELRAILLADAPSRLTSLADVSSVGTTARTASGRPARGPVERPTSEVSWPLQIPSPFTPPVPSHPSITFSGQAPTGSSFRADLALAMSAVALVFSLMARVARPVSSRLHEAALVTRVPQPG